LSSDLGVDGLGIGAALYVPIARGGHEVVEPGPGSYFLRDGNIQAIYTSIAAAYQVADLVAIGVSGSLVDSTWHAVTDVEVLSSLESEVGGLVDFYDQEFEDPGYGSTLTFDHLKDRAFTFGTGLYITPTDRIGISVAFQKGMALRHTGDTSLATNCGPDYATDAANMIGYLGLCDKTTPGTGEVTYSLPSRVHGGIVLTPVHALRIEAMGGWVGWSAFSEYGLNTDVKAEDISEEALNEASAETAAGLASQNRTWARDNENTFWLGLDGKVKPLPILTTGARVIYDKSAIPDRVLSTNNFDSNAVIAGINTAVGIGLVQVGLSYEHTFLASRTVTNSAFGVTLDPDTRKADRYYYPSANGTYAASIDRLGITIAGKLGADKKQ
jgi:long-subunit fatty acid transport protein